MIARDIHVGSRSEKGAVVRRVTQKSEWNENQSLTHHWIIDYRHK